MSGLLYHVLLFISFAWCAVLVATFIAWESSLFHIGLFLVTSYVCFVLYVVFYDAIQFKRGLHAKRALFNFFFALIYLATFWFLPFSIHAISSGGVPIGADIAAIVMLIPFIIIVVLVNINVFDYQRYVKEINYNANLIARVEEYLLSKYPNEEILEGDKNFYVHFAVKKKDAILYDPFNKFAFCYTKGLTFPNRLYDEIRFPKNAYSNCVVDVVVPNLTPQKRAGIRPLYEPKTPVSFSVYVKNGEFSDDLKECTAHCQAENKVKPLILEYLQKKYPEFPFEIGTIKNGRPDTKNPILFYVKNDNPDKETPILFWYTKNDTAAVPLDINGDLMAYVTLTSPSFSVSELTIIDVAEHISDFPELADNLEHGINISFTVWRTNGEFFDDLATHLEIFLEEDYEEEI